MAVGASVAVGGSGLGVVRPAKRPAGWIAPGPRPNTPVRVDLVPGPGEDLCYLAGDYRIFQRQDGHRWSADDLITAHFAVRTALAPVASGAAGAPAPPRRIVDLGCGIGTVLLFLAWRFPDAACVGIEAQEISAGLAARSVALNGIEERCSVRLGDLRDPGARAGLEGADLVTGTPPYLPVGSGPESQKVQCGPCRFEHRGGIEDYCLAAATLMAPGASFVGCAAGFQRARVAAAAKAAGLAVTRWRDVLPKPGKPALFAVFAMRRGEDVGAGTGAGVGTGVDEEALLLRGADGRFTVEHDLVRHELGIPVER
jgi:tRNA1Val (adenine37-N6)-methyltransferase